MASSTKRHRETARCVIKNMLVQGAGTHLITCYSCSMRGPNDGGGSNGEAEGVEAVGARR
jgi:hypothetical protein